MTKPSDKCDPIGRAGLREWSGLVLLTLPLFVLAIDVSVLFLAAPHIDAALRPSETQLLWVLDIYGFMIAGALMTMGRLGDRIGARRLLLIGALAFSAVSVFAAFAPGPSWLVFARALLGIAGATLMPSTLALIKRMFLDAEQRRVAIAAWMSVFSGGVAIGPAIGGAILEAFWWGAVFLLAVPPMLIVVVLGPALLPESREPQPGRVDPLSVAMSFAAVLPLIWALKQVAASQHIVPALLIGTAGLTAGWFFLRRQSQLADPLVDLALFRTRKLRVALLWLFAGLLIANAMFYLYPQTLQLEHRLTPLAAGALVVPVAMASVLGTLLSPRFAARFSVERVFAAGLAVSTLGFILVMIAGTLSSVMLLAVGFAVTVFGVAPLPTLGTDRVISAAPEARTGSAAAITETTGELTVGLAIALAGSLVIAVGGIKQGLILVSAIGAVIAALLSWHTARSSARA